MRCPDCQDFGITEEMKFCFCNQGDNLLILHILAKEKGGTTVKREFKPCIFCGSNEVRWIKSHISKQNEIKCWHCMLAVTFPMNWVFADVLKVWNAQIRRK